MKIIAIIKKEELSADDLVLIKKDCFIKKYEDIVSHDRYWVIQDVVDEINEQIIYESFNSVYVFDRKKVGASGGCFRVDVYDTNMTNPNAIVNFYPWIEKGRWFNNTVINYESEEDMEVLHAIIKHDDFKNQLMSKTLSSVQQSSILKIIDRNLINQTLHDEQLNQNKSQKRSHFMFHQPCARQAQSLDFYLGGPEVNGKTTTVQLPSNLLRSKQRMRKKSNDVCLIQ